MNRAISRVFYMAELTDTLTVQQAYFAMFEFLKCYYERGSSEEIGGMLGSLSLLPDGNSADPAALDDFIKATHTVLSCNESGYHSIQAKLE